MAISTGEFVSNTSSAGALHQSLTTMPAFVEKKTSVLDEISPNEIPKSVQSIPKKLFGYCITIADISLRVLLTVPTLLVVCALSIPVAFIKVVVESIINRYMHYRKYHHSVSLFNCKATLEQKRITCEQLALYHDDFLYSFIVHLRQVPLQDQHDITGINNLATHLLLKNTVFDVSRLAILFKQLPKKMSKSDVETIEKHEQIVDNAAIALEKFMNDLYKDNAARNQSPKDNQQFIELKDNFFNACEQLITIVAEVPEASSTDKDALPIKRAICLYTQLDNRRKWFASRYKRYRSGLICPYCCPICNSFVAEVTPSIVRAFAYTLPHLPTFSVFAPVMGVCRSAQMVISFIWGRYSSSKPINYFPWHPGKFHRFPFSRPGFNGLESMGCTTKENVSASASASANARKFMLDKSDCEKQD